MPNKTVQIRDMDAELWAKVRIKAAQLGLSIKDYAAKVFSDDVAKEQ